jgi:hypothetical protein
MKYFELRRNLDEIGINPRFAIDIASVIEGVRDYGLMHINISERLAVIDVLYNYDCKVFAERTLHFTKDNDSREGLLFDSSDPVEISHCELWFCHSAKAVTSTFNPFENPGYYLGYPDCCVKKYESNIGLGSLYREYLFSSEKVRYHEVNRLCTLFNSNLLMPDYFPCSLSCEEARAYSCKMQKIIDNIYYDFEKKQSFGFKLAPLLIFDEKLYCFPNFIIENQKLIVKADNSAQFVNLRDVLDDKYWPKMGSKILVLRFLNVSHITELFIEGADIPRKFDFEFI